MLVTHDRYLLDRVSTAVLGLDGRGGAQIYADYWQWEQAQSEAPSMAAAKAGKPSAAPRPDTAPSIAAKKRLGYLEAREFERMEERILEAEEELAALHAGMQAADVVSDGARLRDCYEKTRAAEARVEALYARWAELEAKQQ
jgi:ATP-binding cassette subfamily F protein uup